MADKDRKLVVRNASTSMRAEGFPQPAVISALLSKKKQPLETFWAQDKTFTHLLFVARTNILPNGSEKTDLLS